MWPKCVTNKSWGDRSTFCHLSLIWCLRFLHNPYAIQKCSPTTSLTWQVPRSARARCQPLSLSHTERARAPTTGKMPACLPYFVFLPLSCESPTYAHFTGISAVVALYCCGVSGAALRCCTLEWPFCWTQSLGKKKPHSHSYPMKMENLQEWEPIMQMGLYWGCIVTCSITIDRV